ncbi:TRAP transporter small permease [Peptoniphilus sp.]|jgi:C4-dicarboxylate transporter DctQ subunit|uniref:TRAP transporter small permease n=1 Tax=Peptoniphilus sp. TaxID=1971214 RepID=UPI003D937D55
MKNLFKKYNKVEEVVLIASLVINVIIVFTQVIMRYFFNSSLSWSEELSRYIFIWQVWLGTSIAFVDDQHINVDLIYQLVKSKKGHKILDTIRYTVWLIFNLYLVKIGFELIASMSARNALSSGMRIPLAYVYVVLPISAILLSIRIIDKLIDIFKTDYSAE